MSRSIILTLLTKPGCHLCEEARMAVDLVVSEIRIENSGDVQIEFQEKNILEDQALLERYSEEIPVLQINGETHAYWRVDPDRLKAKIAELLTN